MERAVGNGAWRNRIVGEGDEDPTQLLANPYNWRVHSTRQRSAMRGALREVGWVQRVIVNRRTGHVVDGHLRIEEAISAGSSVPVLYVDLDEDEEKVVLATLDPIGAMAGQSEERLQELLSELTVGDEALRALLGRLAHEVHEAYTSAIRTPVYEPTGDRPDLASLRDETKADELRGEVMAADLPDDVRAFLLAAASRHTRFHYGRIAEFYAHAPADVQRLMERSALVIIDFDDAIRNGYVRFLDAIAELEERDRDGA